MEGGGEEGERAGEVATSPRKSRVMPTRNCTTPRAPLPTPPRSVLLSYSPLARHPVRFSRFFHRPSVSLILHLIPPHLPSPSSLFPHEIPPAVPRVWCAFSPASTSHLTDLIHPQRITPSSAAPAVSAAPPANLGETETIATPTSSRRD